MPGQCHCGAEVRDTLHGFGCLECGASRCQSCAIELESATYCPACADAVLESSAVPGRPFDLH
jgi:hypothetical protein